ncbi:MAG: DEAD/DEAH box helicase, partial [Muribaculaceae bacterium]|nr:DEAD/DEAH box helicase [Muribaculaceae bacterium]
HLSMGYVDLSKVSFFILDEADRMLDMGFYDDIMQIYSHLPKNVQVLMFSATMPPKIQQMASKILKDPVEIKLAVSKPAEKIRQSAYICHETQKLPILQKIFRENPPQRVIVFSSSKIKVKNLARELRRSNLKIGEMHSDLDQNRREDVMLDFKSGKINVVVATDIISRGIDIDDIEMVINFDVPREAEDYVHRIGRTARADRDGRAVTFVSKEDFQRLARIERLLEKAVPREPVPEELGEAPSYSGSSRSAGKVSGRGRNAKSRKGGKRAKAVKPAQGSCDESHNKSHNKHTESSSATHSSSSVESVSSAVATGAECDSKKNGNGKRHFHRHKTPSHKKC